VVRNAGGRKLLRRGIVSIVLVLASAAGDLICHSCGIVISCFLQETVGSNDNQRVLLQGNRKNQFRGNDVGGIKCNLQHAWRRYGAKT
jgi:hypothetical protein